jgi:hypothetical protein
MTSSEHVLTAHPTAVCAELEEMFQILMPPTDTGSISMSLSCVCSTAEEAWEDAEGRLNRAERYRSAQRGNIAIVKTVFPAAYLHEHRFFQIRRPRLRFDKSALVSFVSLSGRFSSPELAWKDAAERIRGAANEQSSASGLPIRAGRNSLRNRPGSTSPAA